MNEKIIAIEKNDIWKFTSVSHGKKAIGVKQVFKEKKNTNGEVERYNIRLVAKQYNVKVGIGNDEVFSPVTRPETIRLIIYLIAQKNGEFINQT